MDQMLAVLKQAALGVPVAELISSRLNICEQTFYRWKKAYSRMNGI